MKRFLITILLSFLLFYQFTFSVFADDDVTIPTEGDSWIEEVFGSEGLKLNILKPLTFWELEGTASIWSIAGYLFSFLTMILFVSCLVAVGIGIAKMMSSGGEEGKLQSGKKWATNAAMGVVSVIVIFIVANFITWLLGVGNIFNLAQNVAVCGEGANSTALYEYKKEKYGDPYTDVECTCPDNNSGWDCSSGGTGCKCYDETGNYVGCYRRGVCLTIGDGYTCSGSCTP
jgi:hypothetical protein